MHAIIDKDFLYKSTYIDVLTKFAKDYVSNGQITNPIPYLSSTLLHSGLPLLHYIDGASQITARILPIELTMWTQDLIETTT